ncbi:hypothetical protein LNKW23_11460 [Paralimibaculum aggregatum]|uniref:Uncharacterized protein n=1 Tax=Paralimibaculum aggregatum TaxID=3036245 RepID=A0ABQ6LF27_9RHOB|nr:hypothetical protein LNKW23_11460 [Limibaculum sp. NKW23]
MPIPTGRPAAVICLATETRIAAKLILSGADRYRLPRGADAAAVLLAGCEGRRLACPAGWAALAERILRAKGPRYGLRDIARLSAAMRSARGT